MKHNCSKGQRQWGVFLITALVLFFIGFVVHGSEDSNEPRLSSSLEEEESSSQRESGKTAEGDYEKIVVLGARSGSRSIEASTAPVDLFDSHELSSVGGGGDMIQSLQALIPSFASNRAYDGSAFVVPTTMRGGTADQTLVLINGKRRHRSAVLHLFSPPANKGAHGPDIGMIPTIAVKNVEVLRDGAAAQYGSDAIAGVMNFALKDASRGGSLEMVYGNHFEGEQNWRISGNVGAKLCQNGFLNISVDTDGSEHLSRGEQNPNAQALINQGLEVDPSPFNDDGYVQTWGRPALSGTRFFANSSCKISGNMDLYAFGNYSRTKGEWSFFYRDVQGNRIFTPDVWNRHLAGASNLDRVAQVGFTPILDARQDDTSLTVGVKGEGLWGNNYDFSMATGENTIDYTLKNSLNSDAPLGDEDRAIRDFNTTDLKQEELRFNADLSRDLGNNDDMILLYGLEFRRETYTQYPGDFPARVGGGVSGMQGTKLADAGTNDRDSYALYADVEHSLNDKTFLQYALRFEDYSDFGNTLTGKVAGHYSLSSSMGLRGALSTGFRAPTPGQVNLTTTLTNFSDRDTSDPCPESGPPTPGCIEEIHVRHVSTDSEMARSLGATDLTEEQSLNVSFGVVSRLARNMNLTVDVYQMAVSDRIYRNEVFGTTQDANNVVEDWSFYTNALDTQHLGLDVIWTTYFPNWASSLSFAYNYNTVKVTDTKEINGQQVVSDAVINHIEKDYPNHRFTLTSNTQLGDKWDLLLRGRYLGDHYDSDGFIGGDANGANKAQTIDPVLYFDFEVAYNVREDLSVVFGASNFLNTYPTKLEGEDVFSFAGSGFNYSPLSVAGYDGGSWYLKGVYTF